MEVGFVVGVEFMEKMGFDDWTSHVGSYVFYEGFFKMVELAEDFSLEEDFVVWDE